MRRIQTGWETNDLTHWDSSTQSGSWTAAASASATRTGSGTYGMRINWDAVTRGRAFVETQIVAAKLWYNYQSAAAGALLFKSGTASSFQARWYYRTNQPKTSNNIAEIFRATGNTGSTAVNHVRVIVRRLGSPDRRVATLTPHLGTEVTGTYDLSDNWYRFVVYAEVDASGVGYALLRIYDENTETLVETLSCPLDISAASADTSWIQLGNINIPILTVTQNGVQFHDFDDFALNDYRSVGSNIHNTLPGRTWPGSVVALHSPITPDVASPTTAWTSTDLVVPITNYTEVDDGATINDADYVYSIIGPILNHDIYNHTAYAAGGGGADVVQSVAVQFRHGEHTAGGNADVNFAFGIRDGSANNLEAVAGGAGAGPAYHITIISEISGGGALTNAWYAAAYYSIRKVTNAGVNDKRVYTIRAEAEDNDPIPAGAKPPQRNRFIQQAVPRSNEW